jgi:UTP--glucose-1-phosphate uridylyltransferase
VQKVEPEEICNYGTIKIGSKINEKLFEVSGLVEKPKSAEVAPSLYAIMGRYVFGPSIYDAIEHVTPHAQGEIQLTDAIAYLVEKGERVLAVEVEGKLFDIGQAHGWFAANMYLGLYSAAHSQQMRKILKALL